MLVDCGFVRACTPDGLEFTFKPSFRRISELGDPQSIVSTYVGLFGPRAAQEAAFVLSTLCEQEDPGPMVGWVDADGPHVGAMPVDEQILIARHLMQHGIAGKARPGKGDGKFSDRFECAEYISAARVHLGLSSADAEALSMTEFQIMFAMKFPDQGEKKRDVPSREEYDAAMKAHQERNRG